MGQELGKQCSSRSRSLGSRSGLSFSPLARKCFNSSSGELSGQEGQGQELSRCQDLNRALGYWPCGHRGAGEKGSAQPSLLYLEITVSRLLWSLLRLSCPAVTFQPPGYRPCSLMTSISSSMLDMKGSSILHTNLQEGP